jgi:Tfp pilus assembly protein PilX
MRRQSGTTLLVVLIMLVVLTLLAVSGMRMGTSSLQIVGNMQARKFVDNVAQQAMEDVMNSIVPFNAPTGQVTLRSGGTTVAANSDTWTSLPAPAGIEVKVSTRTCLFSAPASGYSAVSTIAPEDNLWQFTVDVRDTFTKSSTSMMQGAKIRQLFGACP